MKAVIFAADLFKDKVVLVTGAATSELPAILGARMMDFGVTAGY